jgi:putative NADPH-quinone reductase
MRALIVYCHPRPGSFTAAIRDVVMAKLQAAGAEIRQRDLYAEGFQPVLQPHELAAYLTCPDNRTPVEDHCRDVEWCDTLIFIYPTWWYGLPAMLKGWLDRVLLPDVAFTMPTETETRILPALQHITRLGVFTTCGASWLLTFLVGFPGRRQLMRGVGWLCARRLRHVFAAHYQMDASTPESRARHLARVARKMDRLIGRPTADSSPVMEASR